jgi:hypothetical protein
MRNTTRLFVALCLMVGSTLASRSALAQQVQPQDLGIVQAPTAGSLAVAPPPDILHSAEVAFKQYDAGAKVVSAVLDKDDVLAIWEVKGTTSEGRSLEADVRPDGTIEELEIEIGPGQVPEAVQAALAKFAAGFTPTEERPRIEKSVRPSAIGLSEIWYEFSGTAFDVEIRSDGRAVLIEPA